MVRDIIEINEELCNGCGDCVVGCSEGAIQIVDGKAKLVKEQYCDGFGDCIGHCPTGALTITRRDAEAFSDEATKQHLLTTEGPEAVQRYIIAQMRHDAEEAKAATPAPVRIPVAPMHHAHHGGGCPGSAHKVLKKQSSAEHRPHTAQRTASAGGPTIIPSELEQWPVQLHLVQPGAPFFDGKECVVMSTCGPIASAEVHQRYLRGRSVVVACPKLDRTDPYVTKMAAIFAQSDMPRVHVVIMEVPCCGGLSQMVQQAAQLSGRNDLVVEEHILALDGHIKSVREVYAPAAV